MCKATVLLVTFFVLYNIAMWPSPPQISKFSQQRANDSSQHSIGLRFGVPFPDVPNVLDRSTCLDPLTPKSDRHPISPFDINFESNIEVKRTDEMITN